MKSSMKRCGRRLYDDSKLRPGAIAEFDRSLNRAGRPTRLSADSAQTTNSGAADVRDSNWGNEQEMDAAEQKRTAERVLKCHLTDYYEILGLVLTASGPQIDMARLKLELMTNPEYNRFEGAEAFESESF